MKRTSPLFALLLAACSGPDGGNGKEREEPVSNAASANTATSGVNGSKPGQQTSAPLVSQFTQGGLKPCRIIDENEQEGPYYRHLCPGVGGYQYEVVESDLRQTMVIVAPNGARGELPLSRVGGGGFSVLGPTMEWRGPAGARPRSVTLRFNVQQSESGSAKSYLVVVRLEQGACIIGAVPPGPGQNERARDIADGAAGTCLYGQSKG